MPELNKNINFKTNKDSKTINKEFFNKIKVKENSTINIENALNYVINNKLELDYYNEIDYLYNNIVIPKSLKKKTKIIKEKILKTIKYKFEIINTTLLHFKETIDSSLNKSKEKFKNDPLNDLFQQEFQTLSMTLDKKEHKFDEKNYIFVQKRNVNFYEKYVDGFKEYKDLYSIYLEYIKLQEIVENQKKKYEDLCEIKAKYEYIISNIKDFLINNKEEYTNYYKEWKNKNRDKIVIGYELEDLLKDIKRLIPLNDSITIIGRDKSNFTLILYLFQQNYFLKDYI